MFNKMIMPAEYRSEAQTRSDTERKIWRFYIFQIVFRTCVDFGFLSVQYNVYPYRFGFQKLYTKSYNFFKNSSKKLICVLLT